MQTDFSFGDDAFWNWRPETYDDPSLATICNIFGTVRRRMAWDHFEKGGTPPPDFVYADRLSPHDRAMWTRLGPANMGGEFLPPMEPREIEIARVELLSVTGDVYSVRARRFRGRIRYRVVDEYETDFVPPFRHSDEPLTLRELVRVIEETRHGADGGTGLVRPFWTHQIECGDGPEEAVGFATVRSVLYEPRLTQVYERLAEAFIDRGRAEQSGSRPGG